MSKRNQKKSGRSTRPTAGMKRIRARRYAAYTLKLKEEALETVSMMNTAQLELFAQLTGAARASNGQAAQMLIVDVQGSETEEQAAARAKGEVEVPARKVDGGGKPPKTPKAERPERPEKPERQPRKAKPAAAPAAAPVVAKAAVRDARVPKNGTVLTGKSKGKEYSCKVVAEGFQIGKKVYPSLSAAARACTGLQTMNGFLFFGLVK